MDCEGIRERLQAGADSGDAEVAEHLAGCPACALVVTERERSARPAGNQLDALFGGLATELEAERGPLAWLRSRPTWLRRLLFAGVALLTILLALLTWGRVDLAHYPGARLASELGVLLLLGFGGIWLGLRRDLGPSSPAGALALVALALLTPFVAVLLLMAHGAHPISLTGAGDDLVPRALGCLIWGSAAALPPLFAAAAMERLGGHDARRDALFAAAAGLMGLAALQLHCPITQPVHLVAGHAPVVAAIIGGYAVARRVRGALRRRT